MSVTKTFENANDQIATFEKNMENWSEDDIAFYDQIVDIVESARHESSPNCNNEEHENLINFLKKISHKE